MVLPQCSHSTVNAFWIVHSLGYYEYMVINILLMSCWGLYKSQHIPSPPFLLPSSSYPFQFSLSFTFIFSALPALPHVRHQDSQDHENLCALDGAGAQHPCETALGEQGCSWSLGDGNGAPSSISVSFTPVTVHFIPNFQLSPPNPLLRRHIYIKAQATVITE